jgi:hypothetical protein
VPATAVNPPLLGERSSRRSPLEMCTIVSVPLSERERILTFRLDDKRARRVALGEDRGALRVPPLGAKLFDPLRLGFGNSLEQLDGRVNG